MQVMQRPVVHQAGLFPSASGYVTVTLLHHYLGTGSAHYNPIAIKIIMYNKKFL